MRVILFLLISLYAASEGAGEVHQSEDLSIAQSTELVELWRRGDSEHDDMLFGTIVGIASDSQGRVFVVDWQHPVLYVFSDTGALVREVGRKGRGPGEFERLSRVIVGEADTVFAWDSDMKRVTIFSPDAYDAVKTVQIVWEGVSNPLWLAGVVPEGFILTFSQMFMEDDPRTDLTHPVYLANRAGVQQQPMLAELPVRKMITFRFTGASGYWWLPFGGLPRHTVSAAGQLYSGHGDSTTITVRSPDRRIQHRIKLLHAQVPIVSEDLEDHFKDKSRRYRRTMREVGLPKTKPVFQYFVVDDYERVWMQLSSPYGAATTTWVILDGDGTQVAQTTLPVNVRLEAVREERAYGVLKKDNGAEVLVAYAIR